MPLTHGKLPRGSRIVGWARLLLILPLFIIVLVFFFLPLGILSGIGLVLGEICVWLKMFRKGRYLSRNERKRRLVRGDGTIIIESPTIGWNITRAWWTEEDVLMLAPSPPPNKDALINGPIWNNTFLRWAHSRYTDIDCGQAYLLAVWNGARFGRKLSKRYPQIKLIDLWSGPVAIETPREQSEPPC